MSLRPLALGASLAICAPALWGALVEGDVAPGAAATRLGLTIAAALLVASWFEGLVTHYGRPKDIRTGEEVPPTDRPPRRAVVDGVPEQRRRTDTSSSGAANRNHLNGTSINGKGATP